MPLVLALWPLNSIHGLEPCLTTLPTSDGTVQWQGFLSVLGEQPKRCSLKVKESSHLTLLSSPTQAIKIYMALGTKASLPEQKRKYMDGEMEMRVYGKQN